MQAMNESSSKISIILSLTSLWLISGCAPMISGAMNMSVTPEIVAQKTAKHFGVSESQIQITNLQKEALTTNYQVRTGGKLYNCSLYYGDVQCKQPGT